MKTGKVIAMLSLMVAAADAECLTVHLQNTNLVSFPVLQGAESTTLRIFGDIDVPFHWTRSGSRTKDTCATIEMQFTAEVPARFQPRVLAYALPYQYGGTQIQVFVNRILACPTARENAVLLGHVMAHEIGHVLEAVSRHSDEGVMKANWTIADLHKMFTHPLRFAPVDADLIHTGLSSTR